MITRTCALVVAVACAAFVHPAMAQQTMEWVGAGSPDWSDPSNWDLLTLPTPLDHLTVSNPGVPMLPGSGTMTIDNGGTVSIQNAGVDVVLDAAQIGQTTGTAELTLANGATLSLGTLTMADNSSVNSAMFTIDGASATTAGQSIIGEKGTATLTIQAGGQYIDQGAVIGRQSSAVGAALVTGHGSQWLVGGELVVGESADNCELIVNGGARLESLGAAIGKNAAGTKNMARISGVSGTDATPSTWDARGGSFYVGPLSESNTLDVLDGARLYTDDATIGSTDNYAPSNTITVSGAGSLWDLGGHALALQVGDRYGARLVIADGGAVDHVSTLRIGSNYELGDSSSASVSVGGTETTTLNVEEMIIVGDADEGTIGLGDHGLVNCPNVIIQRDSYASVKGEGAEWNISEDLAVGYGGTGRMNIYEGSVTVGDELNIWGTSSTYLDVRGGTLTFARFGTMWDRPLTHTSGTVHVTSDDVVFGPDAPLGTDWTVPTDGEFIVDQAIGIETQSSLSVDAGGRMQAGHLQNDGTLNISGTVETTNPAAELRNDSHLTLAGGTIAGGSRLLNRFAGVVSGHGTIDTDFVNFGQATFTDNTDCTADTTNYGTLTLGGSGTSYRSGGTFTNHGRVTLGNALDGDGELINEANGVIETGTGSLHGISLPVTNRGVIRAKSSGGCTTLIIEDLTPGNLAGGVMVIDDGCAINVLSNFDSAGLIQLNGPGAALLGSGTTNNTGTIIGQGRVAQNVVNAGEVNVAAGAELMMTGTFANAAGGVVDIGAGATFNSNQGMSPNAGGIFMHASGLRNGGKTLTNDTAGYITGSGVIYAPHLINLGHIGVGAGGMDIDGALTNDGTFDIQPGVTLTVYGPTDGSGAFTGAGTVVLLGDVSPGSSPGSLAFDGNLVLGGTTLHMELGGNQPTSQYDQLIVGGELSIDGVLDISLYNNWTPRSGDVYDLLAFNAISGTFSNVVLPALGANLAWDTTALYATGSISVIGPATLLGDANNDGVVSADDFAAVQTNFGNTGASDGLLLGDANDDGVVSADDFAAIQTNFGNVSAASNFSAPIPEPATIAMFALGGIVMSRRHTAARPAA